MTKSKVAAKKKKKKTKEMKFISIRRCQRANKGKVCVWKDKSVSRVCYRAFCENRERERKWILKKMGTCYRQKTKDGSEKIGQWRCV